MEEYLKKCTVRLSLPGKTSHEGTGFFVGEGLILSCFHVIKKAQDKTICVHWQGNDYTAEVEESPEDTNKFDLVLLRLTTTIPNQPSITWEESLPNLGAELYSFGYIDDNPHGEPGTFEYEGIDGREPPLIKFKSGQVRPGLSGSPLLNQRTGKVCGIVKRTRDRGSDLGGRAIPVSVIWETFPQLKPKVYDNPFVYLSGRVPPEKLFGREKEITDIFGLLGNHNSVALIGDRQIGKSSLLGIITHQTPQKLNRKPIDINLGNIADAEDFYDEFCYQVGIKVCKGSRLNRAITKLAPENRILLILDEAENIKNDWFTEPLRKQIRALAEGENHPLLLLVATSVDLDKLFADSGKTSPFENVCVKVELKPWDEPTCRSFIRNNLRNNALSFAKEEVDKLIRQSRGHPQELMRLCYSLYRDKMP